MNRILVNAIQISDTNLFCACQSKGWFLSTTASIALLLQRTEFTIKWLMPFSSLTFIRHNSRQKKKAQNCDLATFPFSNWPQLSIPQRTANWRFRLPRYFFPAQPWDFRLNHCWISFSYICTKDALFATHSGTCIMPTVLPEEERHGSFRQLCFSPPITAAQCDKHSSRSWQWLCSTIL